MANFPIFALIIFCLDWLIKVYVFRKVSNLAVSWQAIGLLLLGVSGIYLISPRVSLLLEPLYLLVWIFLVLKPAWKSSQIFYYGLLPFVLVELCLRIMGAYQAKYLLLVETPIYMEGFLFTVLAYGLLFGLYLYKFMHSVVNTSLIDTQQEIQKRIHEVYLDNISQENRAKVNHQYRKNSLNFLNTLRKDELLKENVSEFQLHFDESENSFRNSVSAVKNGVDIKNLGQGEKVILGVENAYSHLKEMVKILLIEEPENHLSYQNLHKLVNMLSSNTGVQVFIGTHSNMIASRLGVDNLHFLDNGQISKLEGLNRDTIRFFQKSTNQNLLNFSLGKKIMLVEGNAEYILMEKFFEMTHSKKPEDFNVSIISVDGLSFERYLEITTCFLDKKVVVITDNDSDYAGNVQTKYSSYQQFQNIKVSSDLDNNNRTFEICIYNNNKALLDSLGLTKSKDLAGYMLREKAEFALRLLEQLETDSISEKFVIPNYIKEAIEWIIKD